ncbi:MAG: AI-2E family transporter [Verrucomicrobiae bacterium]|nr:AI-2E family transporter [Verrucomicrobiae bacterium]
MHADPPTPFQRKACWNALTAIALGSITCIVVFAGWIMIKGIALLQPILIPVALATILTYLLNPVVTWLCHRGFRRTWSVITVFAIFLFCVVGLACWIGPTLQRQTNTLVKNLPTYTQHVQNLITTSSDFISNFLESSQHRNEAQPSNVHDYAASFITEGIQWIQQKIPTMVNALGHFLKNSIGGVFGIFGTLASLILVPIVLFFFLLESPAIKARWSNYLPLPPSPLKDEIASLLLEINNIIITFFRGQLLVSLVDGAMIATALIIFVHLDFALLLGIMVGILGLIPYAGIIICWIPAVLIAAAQFGDWWHPLLVTFIFLIANNIDGIFVSPRIVGHSVGLHPLTIILSVFTWSILLGGLLGAILAVPLTASLLVLLRRYVWKEAPESTQDNTIS